MNQCFLFLLINFQKSFEIHILCLSNGNFNGLGKTREKELKELAAFLKIANLKIFDHPQLQDGMQEKWDLNVIKTLIQNYCEEKTVNTIITFDKYGVSSHPNHITTHEGTM